MTFISEYDAEYGTEHPNFYQGSYPQALKCAKSELKFLFVYLYKKDHENTSQFCREVLSNADVRDYINSNLVFWGCSVATTVGKRASRALRMAENIFCAVISAKDYTVVGRFEELHDPGLFLLRLQACIRDNETYLVAARAELQEREINAALRLDQDSAYLESLRADQEKERIRQKEIEAKAKQLQEQKELQQSILEETEKRRVEWAARIPNEPEEEGAGVVHIVAKLPQGTRLNRRFYANDSLSVLYYYIFCHPDSPDRFQVTTNFPRNHVPCEPVLGTSVSMTFRDFGLLHRTMLFVTDLDA